ncbi:MAG: TonB-dependent receptor [Bacteroidota bacterium]
MSRLLLLLLLAVGSPAFAQSLTGIVTDETDAPLPGANVAVLNTLRGAATTTDGRFSISLAPGDYTVQVSAVGYASVLRDVRVSTDGAVLLVRLVPEAEALGDVVVSASRDEARLDASTATVTAIDAREIQASRLWDLSDLTGRVPSVVNQELGVGFQAIPSIRGIQVFSEVPAVITVVDGVVGQDILAGGVALADVERIEVLRGPQTTLFGRNALGGVINVTTRQPTNAIRGFAEVSGGDLDLGRLSAGISGPVVDDQLFLSGSFLAETRGGYFTNDTTGTAAPLPAAAGAEVGSERTFYGNASLRWLASEQFTASLNLKGQVEDSDASGFFVAANSEEIAQETPDNLFLSQVGEHTRDLTNATLALRYSATSVAVTSTTTLQQIGLAFEAIESGSVFDSFVGDAPGDRAVQTVASQEIRATTSGLPVNVTGGVFGYLQEAREPTTNLLSTPSFVVTDGADVFRNVGENAGFAAFGQATADLADGLSVTAGLRYDVERREATFNGFGDAVLVDGMEQVFRADTTVSGTYSALSPKVALTYALNEDASLYAGYTRGFRAGGVNAQRLPDDFAASYTYDPETSDNVELGARLRLGDRFRASATLYSIWWDDLQFFNLIAPPFTFARENVGDARSQGVEVEASAILAPGLRVDGSLSVLDTETSVYEGFVLSRLDPETFETIETDITGNRLANAPAHTAFLAAEYRQPVGSVTPFARAEVRSVGGYFTDIQNDLRQDAYALVDLRAGVEAGRVEVALWVENLTDERQLVFGAPDTSFNRRSLAGPPRTLGATLRVRY